MRFLIDAARRLVHRRLAGLTEGRLTIREGGVSQVFGRGSAPSATVDVTDGRFYAALATGGHIAAAEAFADGWWTTADLTELVRLLLRNRALLDGLESGVARLVQPLRRLAHAVRRNSRLGSRRNIAAHYDLGNDFFRLFLDETMTYSSAYFPSTDTSLAEAQRTKYDMICQKLGLTSAHRVIEIGSGWGGFAIHAAERYGCQVVTTTISAEQHRHAAERVAAAGLADRVTVLQRDYRDLDGQFDRLVSIEMIEAVGHQYYLPFFEVLSRLLVDDGMAAVQAITIQDRYYESARREVDFIKRHIFPGSCIPSHGALLQAMGQTDLRLAHAEDFGAHYARTLAEWHRRFVANGPAITGMGFDQWFQRIWQFYFGYCEGGFLEGTLGVSQLVFAKPGMVTAVPERRDRRAAA